MCFRVHAMVLLIAICVLPASAQLSSAYVTFHYPGLEDGSSGMPFDTLGEAIAVLNPGGTVYLGGGNSHETLLLDEPMTLRSDAGVSRVGKLGAPAGSGSPYERLRITEIMYHPADGGAEYLELQNTGAASLDVSGVYFSMGITFTFPASTMLSEGEYIVLVRDSDGAAFSSLYPSVDIGGSYSGVLSNGGETIELSDPSDNVFLSLTYNDAFPWPEGADGLGFSLVVNDPNYPLGGSTNWRSSSSVDGSPGASESNPTLPQIWINEVLTHTDLPGVDAVEFFNSTGSTVDISGWFVTDDPSVPFKAKIPDTSEFNAIPSGGYAVIYESDMFDTPGTAGGQPLPGFRLSSRGETIYLFSANGSEQLTGYVHGFEFGAAQNAVSFGREVTTDNREYLVAQTAVTLGAANSGAKVGPLVMSEIHYNPLPNGVEYIEVTNTSGSTVQLWDTSSGGDPSNTYRITGIGYRFDEATTMSAGDKILIVDMDPDDYILEFGDPGCEVFGPFGNDPNQNGDSLGNGGETIRLQWPDKPDEVMAGVFEVPYIDMDTVRYNDAAPWPNADNNGNSLSRSDTGGFGSEPTHWSAEAPEHQPGQGVAPLQFNVPRGFYDGNFHLTITTSTSNAQIKYTTDGSEPSDTNGTVYSSPIFVNVNRVVRARGIRTNYLDSATETHTYIMNADLATKSLPAISIVGDPGESLYEPNGVMAIVGGEYVPQDDWYTVWKKVNSGDYNNPIQRGIDFERPVSLEVIYPTDNSGTQEDCGIRVQGSDWHRARYYRASDWTGCTGDDLNYSKFSFRLAFRKEYGSKRFEYPFFSQMPAAEFDQLVLRGGHNDTCDPFIKDELVRRLHADMGRVAAPGELAHLFINGQYKGFYNPTVRVDEAFLDEATGETDSWDVITSSSTVRDGDDVAWNQMLNFALTQDLSIQANYGTFSGMLKINAFIDYLILELFTNNADWPNVNWIASRPRIEGGRWEFQAWDSEFAFRESYLYRIAFDEYPQNRGDGLNGEETEIAWIYRALRQNPDFDSRFDERIKLHLFGSGALAPTNLANRFNELKNEMDLAIPGMSTHITGDFLTERYTFFLNACEAEGLYVP